MTFRIFSFRLVLLYFVSHVLASCGGAPGSNTGSSTGGGSEESSDEDTVRLGFGSGGSFRDQELNLIINNQEAKEWLIEGVVVGSDNLVLSQPFSVSFKSTCVEANLSDFSVDSVMTAGGRFSVIYTATSECTGTDTVIAEVELDGASSSTSASVDIDISAIDLAVPEDSTSTVIYRVGSVPGESFSAGRLLAELEPGSIGQWNISGVVLDSEGLAVTSDQKLTFHSSCVSEEFATFSPVEVVTSAGRFSTVYRAGAECTDVDTVEARLVFGSDTFSARVDVNFATEDSDDSVNDTTLKVGNGASSSTFVDGALHSFVRNLAAGEWLVSGIVVDEQNIAVSESYTIDFTSPCVEQGFASFSEASSTTLAGRFSTVFTVTDLCTEADTVIAELRDTTARGTVDIDLSVLDFDVVVDDDPELDSILFLEEDFKSRLNVKGLGYDESTIVKFRLEDDQGFPIVGETVLFSTSSSVGGVAIAEGNESGESNADGEVTTRVISGDRTISSFKVIATHDSSPIRGESHDIVVTSNVPTGINIRADRFNPDGASSTQNVTITAYVSSADGGPPVEGTQVKFSVKPYGAFADDTCEIEGISCSVTYTTVDTRSIHNHLDRYNRTNRTTILAVIQGSEEFEDSNGNALFDEDIPSEYESWRMNTGLGRSLDLGEPFSDENQNGQYDEGEFYIDSQINPVEGGTNGRHDSEGDGEFNGPCVETEERSCSDDIPNSTQLWDSLTLTLSSSTAMICDYINGEIVPVRLPDPTPIDGGAESFLYEYNSGPFYLCDANGNSLPSGTTVVATAEGGQISGAADDETGIVQQTSFTIPDDTTNPYPIYGFKVKVDRDDNTSGRLLLTVTAPSTVNSLGKDLPDPEPAED